MGHAIDALPKGVKNVWENPMLIAISYVISVVLVPFVIVGAIAALVLSFVPIIGQGLARLLVAVPLKVLVLGGMVGAAGAGFSAAVTFGDYIDAVRDNLKSLVGAFALYEAIVFGVGILVGILALVVFGFGAVLGAATSTSSMASTGLGLGMIVLYLGVLGLFAAVAIVFQFLDVAVVLGDRDAVDAFRESWRLTRDAPVSVLGYSILRVLVGFAVVLPGYVVAIGGGMVVDVLAWVGLAIVLLLSPVAFAVVVSYHAAYYGTRLQSG